MENRQMTNKTKVLIAVELPDELCGPYLQHIRDFENKHPGLKFGVNARKDDKVVPPPKLPPLTRH